MPWAFAQFRPHVALRGRLCAVWDILVRGVAKPGYYRLFYPPLLQFEISPHISQGSKKKKKRKIYFRYDVLYKF
jgi:hypothetical protein